MPILSEIWIYPIKSLGGIRLQEAEVQPRGLAYDRRWMLTDPDGRFVTQREIPEMALLGTAIEGEMLRVFRKKNPSETWQLTLSPRPEEMPEVPVQVWNDRCTARRYGPEVNAWFSEQLGQPLQLVYMPDTTRRVADEQYAPSGHYVSFADGFPILIIGQASLDDLNSRLDQPLPMNRFRPNLVITGSRPYEEDSWSQFQISNVPLLGVKPCGRCSITTTDQETARRAAEPLKTLATYRQEGRRILFGQNVVWLHETVQHPAETPLLRVGDAVLLPE